MRRSLLLTLLLTLGFSIGARAAAWPTNPTQSLYAIQAWVNDGVPLDGRLYQLNAGTGQVISSVKLRLAPGNFSFLSNLHGMSRHPTTGVTYAVIGLDGYNDNRWLATVNLSNGTVTPLFKLGIYISSITFNSSGALYGISGEGNDPIYAFYSIDLSNGSVQVAGYSQNVTSGGAGLAFDPSTNKIYRAAEAFLVAHDLNQGTEQVVTTGVNGKAMSLLNIGAGWFYFTEQDNADLIALKADGTATRVCTLPNYMKGLVLAPPVTQVDQGAEPLPTFTVPANNYLFGANTNSTWYRYNPKTGAPAGQVNLASSYGSPGSGIVDMTTQPGTGKIFAVRRDNRRITRMSHESGYMTDVAGDPAEWPNCIEFLPDGRLFVMGGNSYNSTHRDWLMEVDLQSGALIPRVLVQTHNINGHTSMFASDDSAFMYVMFADSSRRELYKVSTTDYSYTEVTGLQGYFRQPGDFVRLGGGLYLVSSRNDSGVKLFNLNNKSFSPILFSLSNNAEGMAMATGGAMGTATPTDTPNGTLTATPTMTMSRTSSPSPTITATSTVTASFTNSPTPPATATVTPTLALSGVLYGFAKYSDSVYKLNPADGSMLASSTLKYDTSLSIMAAVKDPTNGKFYGAAGYDSPRELVELNPATGTVSYIGGTGEFIIDLAVASDGGLWGISGDNGSHPTSIFRINKATGQTTYAFSINPTSPRGMAMCFEPGTGQLLVLSGSGSSCELRRIEPGTGSSELLAKAPVISDAPRSLLALGGGKFLISDKNTTLYYYVMGGDTTVIGGTPAEITGLFIAPDMSFASSTDTPTPTAGPTLDPSLVLWGLEKGGYLRQYDQNGSNSATSELQLSYENSFQNSTGLARNPLNGKVYAIMNLADRDDRILAEVDPLTGQTRNIGSTGGYVNAIGFAGDGTLYGATGGGDKPGLPERSLVKIDLNSGRATLVAPLATKYDGYEGAAIAFNPDDGKLYVAAGRYFGRYTLGSMSYQELGLRDQRTSSPRFLAYRGQGRFSLKTKNGSWYVVDTVGRNTYATSSNGDVFGGYLAAGLTFATATPAPTSTPVPTTTAGFALMADSGGTLYQYDVATQSQIDSINIQVLGAGNIDNLYGLAFDRISERTYAVVSLGDSNHRYLIQVDRVNGVGTLIGETGIYVNALSFDGDGNLFAASGNGGSFNALYTLDVNTGQPTFKRLLPNSGTRIEGNALAYSDSQDKLYWVAGNDSLSMFGVFDLPSLNFNALPLHNMPSSAFRGMAWKDGQLYAGNRNGQLFTLSTDGYVNGPIAYPGTRWGIYFTDPYAFVPATPTIQPTAINTPTLSVYGVDRGGNAYLHRSDFFNGYDYESTPLITVDGDVVENAYGLAKAPNGTLYTIVSYGNRNNRNLATLELITGKVTDIGPTLVYVNSIAVDNLGAIWAATGEASGLSHVFGTLNPVTGAFNLKGQLPYTGQSNSLAWDPDNSQLYWAGTDEQGLFHFGTLNRTTGAFTEIPTTGAASLRPRGMTYAGNGNFLATDDNSYNFTINTSGVANVLTNSTRFFGMILAPLQTFGTITPTFTISPTFTASETANGTFTATPTSTISDTASPTLTVTESFTVSPTLTVTPTFSITKTRTVTKTVSETSTPTETPNGTFTSTVTPTLTRTPVATKTNTPANTSTPVTPGVFIDGRGVLGGNLATSMGVVKRGAPLCMAFASAPADTAVELYNVAGEKVLNGGFGAAAMPCVETTTIAPGLYYLKMKVTLADGRKQDRWQKIAILP